MTAAWWATTSNNLLTIIQLGDRFLRGRELRKEPPAAATSDANSEKPWRARLKLTARSGLAGRQPLENGLFPCRARVDNVAQLIRPLVGGAFPDRGSRSRPRWFALHPPTVGSYESADQPCHQRAPATRWQDGRGRA